MKVLVTGGAGYIGSHVARHLGEAGHDIISFDNLSTGNESAVLYGDLVVGDLKNTEDLDCLFDLHAFDAVLHFAASIVVPDSVTAPLDYYENNVRSTLNLLRAVEEYGVDKFVFSSSAAVYGLPDGDWVEETSPLRPINPYGWSKLMGEQMLQDLSKSSKVRYVILRYFNVAGADPDGRIGQSTPNATHLIKLACKAATGSRDGLSVFGNDYETPDGTCIRDYIHVDDLAAAHCLSLDYLVHGGTSDVFNCGYGSGKSVLEVIEMVKKVSGVDFPVQIKSRRKGDPPCLVAVATKIVNTLKWSPIYNDLESIIEHSLAWERKQGLITSDLCNISGHVEP